MNLLKIWCALLLLSTFAAAQSVPAAPSATSATAADEIRELRAALAAQQKQIAEQQRRIEELAQRLDRSDTHKSPPNFGLVASTTPMIPAGNAASATATLPAPVPATTAAPQAAAAEQSPVNFRYKGVTITPGGFLAAETVWRQHGMAADIGTPFNTIPYPGADQYHLSEFFGTGRQSRLSVLVEGKISKAKLTGYYETDWLSAGTTSNNNESNSYSNRQRQIWGQAALDNGWSFTGGQMWSLVTETSNGLDNRTEKLPSTVDPQYHVGFSWTRQFGFRVVKNFNNKVWLGFAIENPQILLSAHNQPANFVFGNSGSAAGAYNPSATYSYNVSPDYIVKAAFQPSKIGHYEVFGVFSPMRDRVYPGATATPATAAGAYNSTRTGVGGGANARWIFANKHVEFGLHFLGGDGMGRYGTSTLPDATVHQDGTLALLRAYQGLTTLEFHHPKFDVFFNGGAEHVGRYFEYKNATTAVGYGAPIYVNTGCTTEVAPTVNNGTTPAGPSNCMADTRDVIEFTTGFYIKFYNGPKGRLQWGPQYSHIIRNAWAGTGGGPQTTQNMLLTGFRYFIP